MFEHKFEEAGWALDELSVDIFFAEKLEVHLLLDEFVDERLGEVFSCITLFSDCLQGGWAANDKFAHGIDVFGTFNTLFKEVLT